MKSTDPIRIPVSHLASRAFGAVAAASLAATAGAATVEVLGSPSGGDNGVVERTGTRATFFPGRPFGSGEQVLETGGREASTVTTGDGTFSIQSELSPVETLRNLPTADAPPPDPGAAEEDTPRQNAAFELAFDMDFDYRLEADNDLGFSSFLTLVIERLDEGGTEEVFRYDASTAGLDASVSSGGTFLAQLDRAANPVLALTDAGDAALGQGTLFNELSGSLDGVIAAGTLNAGTYRVTHDVVLVRDPFSTNRLTSTVSLVGTAVADVPVDPGPPNVIPSPTAGASGFALLALATRRRRTA